MATLTSKHRLQSNAFVRMDDDKKIAPKRMVFLSVEGERTETDYFRHLDVYLDNSIIRVEVLRHKRGDGYSDPQYVIELLDEYINVRQGELIPEDSAQQLIQKYSEEVIRAYLEDINSIPTTVQKQICEDLVLIGIDIDYRRYLQQYSSADDMFAVVIDRDCGNHSRELMEECVRKCQEKNYGIYVTNPCFEFWLLLHLCDVKNDFTEEELENLRCNPKISSHQTAVGNEVNIRAKHGKSIRFPIFSQYYFPKIRYAINQSLHFSSTFPDLYDQLGSNIPQLFAILGFSDKQTDTSQEPQE